MYEFYSIPKGYIGNKTLNILINFGIIIVYCNQNVFSHSQLQLMSYRLLAFVFLFIFLLPSAGNAQKPFTEGIIIYKVRLQSPDHQEYHGVYTFTIKGPHIKKELKLDNGFSDVIIMDCGQSTVYSLQNKDGKKYAIQLSMADMLKRQEPYAGFTMHNEENSKKNIAGYAVNKGTLNYKNGSLTDIYYSKDWYPQQPVTYERFPDARFLPMQYAYTDEHKIAMEFEVTKIEVGPVENAVFRIPADYKMISYEEYKQLSR